jgi:hypothetical protein
MNKKVFVEVISGGDLIKLSFSITDDLGSLLAYIRLGWKELQDTTVYLAYVSDE